MAEERPKTSDELAQQRTDLAMDRTIIAADRTLMAWIRTAISMIGFGFTLYQFLRYLREAEASVPISLHGPRNFGLALVGLGTAALIVAAVQHRQYLGRLGRSGARVPWSLTFTVAILVALIGVLTFVSILLRAGPF
jgi:putative membrane protein